jgi:hypothetical protein
MTLVEAQSKNDLAHWPWQAYRPGFELVDSNTSRGFDCLHLGGVKPSPLGDGFSWERRDVG